ncbi:hypothetical protein [Labrenzia sp. VG12]|uniref:hypothetical protein n=1 Tax=Labrenzia sp. VG12 TaxID=2021862 RepID=UPI0012FE1E56|nr:hypothetical protein [Labrenzia sp. VG12]
MSLVVLTKKLTQGNKSGANCNEVQSGVVVLLPKLLPRQGLSVLRPVLPCGKWVKVPENEGEAVGGPLGFWFLAARLAAQGNKIMNGRIAEAVRQR